MPLSLFLLPTFIPLKTYIKREYVNASKISNPKKISAINIDKNLHSIRFYDDYIIYGSNAQKLTSKTDYQLSYEKSKEQFKNYFGMESEYTWMNQDIMSNDNLPYIGAIKNNLYLATAYNAWGITNGTIAGKIISDLIINNDSIYKNLFLPTRNSFLLVTKSIFGSFSYIKAYAKSLYKKNNPINIKIKGVIYGLYKDDDHNIHRIKLICPHMKCNLVFNKQEKTWDCPCHGSRFDIDGNLIQGPAKNNLESKTVK